MFSRYSSSFPFLVCSNHSVLLIWLHIKISSYSNAVQFLNAVDLPAPPATVDLSLKNRHKNMYNPPSSAAAKQKHYLSTLLLGVKRTRPTILLFQS